MLEMSITSPTGQALRKLELSGEQTIRIGRAQDCDIRLPSPVVSRHHAQISQDDGEWMFRDLGSTHGSFVDGQRITEVPITPGLVVRVGPARIRFDNLASRIGAELDQMLEDDDADRGSVSIEIIGSEGRRLAPFDDTAK